MATASSEKRQRWRSAPNTSEEPGESELPPPSAEHSAAALIQLALEGDARALMWLRRLAGLPHRAIVNECHATTAAVVVARTERGLPVDYLTLADELESGGHITADTPLAFFTPISLDVRSGLADVYAAQLVQAAKSRHAIHELPGVFQAACANKPDGELNAALNILQMELSVYDELLNDVAGGSRFRLLSLSDLRTQEPAPLLDAETQLRLRQLMLVFARENIGKSAYVLYRLALIAAVGQHVLYVCGEGLPGILDRLEGIIATHHLDVELVEQYFHIIADVPQFAAPSEVDELLEQAQALDEPIAVIALDTLATATIGQNENAPEVMSAAIGGMRRMMRSLDCAGILVHHTGKDGTRGARGHSSLGGSVDISIELTREDDSDVIVIHSRKARDTERFAPIAYQLRPITLNDHADRTTVVVVPSANGPAPTVPKLQASDHKMLETLRSLPDGVRYGAWVEESWKMHQLPASTAKAAIRRLAKAGSVGSDEVGMYHVLPREDDTV